uniref:Uncharacterized protein n=1 Tax=Oryza barthii TaxID=65489 RepID=A0A0D3H3L0_9ORYZ
MKILLHSIEREKGRKSFPKGTAHPKSNLVAASGFRLHRLDAAPGAGVAAHRQLPFSVGACVVVTGDPHPPPHCAASPSAPSPPCPQPATDPSPSLPRPRPSSPQTLPPLLRCPSSSPPQPPSPGDPQPPATISAVIWKRLFF